MIPNASGKIAPPRPWIVRATIINGRVVTPAASNDPAARPVRVTTSTRFLPYMSPSRPAIGVTTDAASRYAVKIHATPEVEVWRSCWSTGRAGTTSDWSSAYAAPPSARTPRIRGGREACAARVVMVMSRTTTPFESCAKMEAPSTTSGGNLRLLYGGTLHLSKHDQSARDPAPVAAPQARRRAPELRRPRGGGARGLHGGRHVGAARGRRRAGGARDRDALPALPDAPGASRGGLRRRG